MKHELRSKGKILSTDQELIWFVNDILLESPANIKDKCIPADIEAALIAVTMTASSRNEIIHAENWELGQCIINGAATCGWFTIKYQQLSQVREGFECVIMFQE